MNSPTPAGAKAIVGLALASGLLIAGAAWFIHTTPPSARDEDLPGGAALTASRNSPARGDFAPAGRTIEQESAPRQRTDETARVGTAMKPPPSAAPAVSLSREGVARAEIASHDPATGPATSVQRATSPGAVWDVAEIPASADVQQTPESRNMRVGSPAALVPVALAANVPTALAEEVSGIPGTQDATEIKEATLLAIGKAITDPSAPNVDARNAMDQLIGAFTRETDAEAKQDFLALASELSDSSGRSMHDLLTRALQPQQPLDVQQQALYLATDKDPALVRKVAADPKHPLREDAEAFLLEAELAAGRVPKPTDDPPTATPPNTPP